MSNLTKSTKTLLAKEPLNIVYLIHWRIRKLIVDYLTKLDALDAKLLKLTYTS